MLCSGCGTHLPNVSFSSARLSLLLVSQKLLLYKSTTNLVEMLSCHRHFSDASLKYFKRICLLLRHEHKCILVYLPCPFQHNCAATSLTLYLRSSTKLLAKCETFCVKMSSACSFIFMQIKVIFI